MWRLDRVDSEFLHEVLKEWRETNRHLAEIEVTIKKLVPRNAVSQKLILGKPVAQ